MSETPRLADLLRQIVESPETPLPDGADEILALSLPDTEAASRLADAPQAARFDNFYPSKAGSRTPSTEGAISKFLENYGTDNPEETSVLERLIFHPVADYSQQLARQEAARRPLGRIHRRRPRRPHKPLHPFAARQRKRWRRRHGRCRPSRHRAGSRRSAPP